MVFVKYKIAARKAFKDAMSKAHPVLLEPIMFARITIPDIFTGDVTGNLSLKRGRILGMSTEEGFQVLEVEVPRAEILRYATELRSITQGRGSFEVDFARYEPVPANIQAEMIAKFKAEHQEDED